MLSVSLSPVVIVALSSSPGCSLFSSEPLCVLYLWRKRGGGGGEGEGERHLRTCFLHCLSAFML